MMDAVFPQVLNMVNRSRDNKQIDKMPQRTRAPILPSIRRKPKEAQLSRGNSRGKANNNSTNRIGSKHRLLLERELILYNLYK